MRLQGGIIVPLITPFKENLEVDYDALKWLVQYLADKGVDGFFPISTTGEFPNLDFEEKINIVREVLEYSGDKLVIAGISGTNVREIIRLGKRFIDMGVEYLITTPPYYYKPMERGLKDFFMKILTRLDVGILLYANPRFTGLELSPNFIRELRVEASNLIGIKATVDSLSYFRKLIQVVKNDFKDFIVLTGMDEYLLPLMLIGGDGGVNALAHLSPDLHIRLIKSIRNNNLSKAVQIYIKIMELKKLYDITPSVTAAIKAGLNILGHPVEKYVRPPLEPVSDDIKQYIQEIFKRIGLL